MDTEGVIQVVFFMAACAVSGGILVDNHPLSKISVKWCPIPQFTAPRIAITRKVTDVLALLSMATAMVSLFAKRESLAVYNRYVGNTWSSTVSQETIGLPWSICLAVFAASTLTVDAHFTWHRYKLSRQIAEQQVPAWQSFLAYTYIWALIVAPWLLMNVLSQIATRSYHFYDNKEVLYNVGAALLILDLPLHVLWSVLMFVLFLRGMKTLRQQAAVQAVQGAAAYRSHVLKAVSTRSAIYVVISLVLYIYCWVIFALYPWSIKIGLTSMPYQIFMSLATHCCFNVRTWRGPEEDLTAQASGVTGDTGTADALTEEIQLEMRHQQRVLQLQHPQLRSSIMPISQPFSSGGYSYSFTGGLVATPVTGPGAAATATPGGAAASPTMPDSLRQRRSPLRSPGSGFQSPPGGRERGRDQRGGWRLWRLSEGPPGARRGLWDSIERGMVFRVSEASSARERPSREPTVASASVSVSLPAAGGPASEPLMGLADTAGLEEQPSQLLPPQQPQQQREKRKEVSRISEAEEGERLSSSGGGGAGGGGGVTSSSSSNNSQAVALSP